MTSEQGPQRPSATTTRSMRIAGGVVGALVVVEITSGVLQGYYTPLFTDVARRLGINDADINWLEALQLLVSAIVVPVLARLGDILGHRRVLLGSLAVTALASWAVAVAPTFPLFLLAWSLQGFYVVWLPLNVAIIYSRARRRHAADPTADVPATTRRATGVIVVALQAGAIGGALLAGQLGTLLAGSLTLVLAVPALLVTAALVVVWRLVPDTGDRAGGAIDTRGAVVLSLSLLAVTGGLSLVRVDGVTLWVGLLVAAGLALGWLFVRLEQRTDAPLIDIALVRRPTLWPVFLTAGLFGVSVLGAQGPLSTFVRTDPGIHGYGLGLTSATASYVIGAYVFSLLIGAGLFARISAALTPRVVLIAASTLVAIGYLSLIGLHGSVVSVVACMVVAGLGSGALVAALPAAAAAAAPADRTAMATGLTNTTKTVGGSFASSAFALALASGVVVAGAGTPGTADAGTAASMSGYITVWAICGGTAILAIVALLTVPKVAFTAVPADAVA